MDDFAEDWRACGLDEAMLALLEYADRLTRRPTEVGAKDVERLRALEWSDQAIHDAVQVCAYFNYINRVANGLGVDKEAWLDAAGRSG